MIFALFFSKTSSGKKLIVMAIHFTHKFFSFLPFGRNDMRTTTTIVHANVSSEVEVEVEVELSKQNNPINSDVSAAVPKDNESDQSNDSDESQKPSPGNVDVAGR